MPSIGVRHTRRRTGAKDEPIEVWGAIQVSGRVGSYPAGSFGLNHITTFVHSASKAIGYGPTASSRALYGSVRDPLTTYRNTVALAVRITGTTGTRAAAQDLVGTISLGSMSVDFHAAGW